MPSFKYTKCLPDGSRQYLLASFQEGSDSFGAILYKENGPAVILKDGTEMYYTNGLKGRQEGPTVVGPTGYQEFWSQGHCGRKDGPAIIYPDSGEDWIDKDLFHRKNGPARIFADGTKQYFYKGKRIEASGDYDYLRKVRLINFANI